MGKLLDGAAHDLREVAFYTDPPGPPSSGGARAPTRAEMAWLLDLVATATHPVAGRLKVLANLVRVLRRCPWIDGALRIELQRADQSVTLRLYSGVGRDRQRALPEVVLDVPLDDLRSVMQRTPELFAPFVMTIVEDYDLLVFVAPS